MKTFLIAYDLAEPLANRRLVVDAIMSVATAWARPLDTVWMVRSDRSAGEIEAAVAGVLRDEDGLVVQDTRGDAHLVNTGLRWFRPRRSVALVAMANAVEAAQPAAEARSATIVPFPVPSAEPALDVAAVLAEPVRAAS
ncbi:MAG TPA: hypothetical protein VFV47_00540 [Hyphomicrobiaceae bacterium]|nr:hypothetical protein [Hyphomicrobiaceae bacterium]